jgi:hypothetical protein
MTTYGGSHTSFDADAFTAGAVVGATAIAGALLTGVAAARASNYERLSREAIEAGLDFSEAMRRRMYDELQRANRQISSNERTIDDLTEQLMVARARHRARRH